MRLCREYTNGRTIHNPEDAVHYCNDFRNQDREFFVVIGLNTRKKVIYKDVVFIGSLDSCVIHPREVFKTAIVRSAACIITVHNHPSGGLTPSEEDLQVWKQLEEAGEIIGITVLDNLIVTQEGFYSSRNEG